MGAFRKVKRYTKPSHEIDEKVRLLNKELKKTGMLSELMTTANMYMYVDTTPTTQPTDDVWSAVPDTSGIRQGFGAPSGSFTQNATGGSTGDDETWAAGWANASQLVNSNTLDGNANTPIVSSPYWNTGSNSNYAGILFYQGLFNPSYWTLDHTTNLTKGISRNPSPSADDYDENMAFLSYIENSIPGFPPTYPEGWIQWSHWVPFSIYNPRIDAYYPGSGRTPEYTGVVKQEGDSYYALLTDWLWVGGSQEYISSPSISASPGHTTVLSAHGSGDPDYSSLVFPDQLPAAAGVTKQAWAQLEDKAFAWGGKKKKPKKRTNTGTTNATMTINGMGLSPEAFENKYNMTPQEYLNPATWQQQSSIDSSDEKIAGHYTAPGASRQLQPDGTYGFPKEGDKVNTGGTKGKDFIYQGGNWIPLAFAGSDATQVAVKGTGGSPYQDYEDPNKDKKFVPPPKDMPKPGGKPPIKTAEIDGTQVAGGHYGYGNKGFVDIPGLDWQVSPTQLQQMKDNPERFNLSPAQIRMIKKAEKKMNKQTVSAHYEPQGDDLVENVVIDPVVKAEKKDKFFNAKDIQPEYPKDAPPKLVKGRHPNLIPPTPKNKFVKVTKKDLLRNHKLTSDEVEEVMITINAINEYVSVNPNILKYIQQRYPTNDVRLAELNFKLDRQMVASELYIENQFPENEKVFERIKTITKKNIAATDPKNMEDVKQPPNYLQLELQPPEPLKIKETVTRHFKKKFKTKYSKKWNKGLW